ncbi:Rha family transcriptional regulator [Bartonella henselae]|uniref:Rha family transcriptional regulator n=1 Tax=Bartonella henselae TaxID=38323 RepID=UPI0009654FFE|nr:Rha family transcriptional regulator [Bartonella henselae]OLL54177.1 anti-repressor protein [Bartonella henselae]UJM33103.1 Rha family transcriptional regulator [Bartonella henselae]
MNNLVTINSAGIVVTTSLKIAEGVGNSHATVIKLVRQNIEDFEEFEEFGRVGFEILPFGTKGGRQKRVIAILNESQATLLMTYMRNNDTMRAFKKALVKAFYDLKNQLIDNDRDTRFDFPSNWDEMGATEKAVYIYGPLHMHLVKAFTLVEESKHYKKLVEEAKQVLEKSVVKVA